MILLIVIILLLIYFYKFYKNSYFYWRNQNVNGPFPIPFVNDYYRYFFKPMHDCDLDCLNKYGKIYHSFSLSAHNELTIAEPELIKEILVKDFRQFNGKTDGQNFAKYFQKVLFFRDETSNWKQIRQIITPLFTSGKLKLLYSNLNKPIKNLMEGLDEQIKNQESFDNFNPIVNFKRFTFDITLNLFFSVEFNSFKIKNDDFIEKFLNAKPTSTLLNIMVLFLPIIGDFGKLFKVIPMDRPTYHYLVKLTLNCIEERKKNEKYSNYNDLLQLLIQTGLSDEEIVGQCLGLFLGGFESVAQTCAFTLYELALHPNLQDRLYKEIKELYPEDNLEIDYDKINKSSYLEAIIKETLRMHLVITKIFRKALIDCELGGIKLKKGHFISIPVYAIHHCEDFYKDPFKFDPERFMNGNEPEPFTYLPFSDGPRTCIAMRLAQLEIRYFLINFIKRYEVYRTKHTKVPLKYYKFNFLFNCEDILIGIKSRKKEE